MQKISRSGKLVAAAVMTTVAAASVITMTSDPSGPAPVNVAEAPSSRSTPTTEAPSRDDSNTGDSNTGDSDTGDEPADGEAQDPTREAPRPPSSGQVAPAPTQRSTSPTTGADRATPKRRTGPEPSRTLSPPSRPSPTASPRPTPGPSSSPTPGQSTLVGDLLDALLGG